LRWARKQPGFTSIRAIHRNGDKEFEWEEYPEAQLTAVFEISKLLVANYKLDDVTGHDCIAPERKEDPGPAFPMEDLRVACGFTGLPAVNRP
jgi:N-acetylmuramoyl-L-alanine amidase